MAKPNINTASKEELMSAFQIGAETADRIMQARPIKSPEDLKSIPGISDQRMQDLIEAVEMEGEEGGEDEGEEE